MHKIIFAALILPSLAFGQSFPQFNVPANPDHAMTPGAVNDPPTPLAVLCDQKGHSTKKSRHATASDKKWVLHEYGIDLTGLTKDQKKAFRQTIELDDLVSLELDGVNVTPNLWPQSRVTPTHNANQKDLLENKLHAMVCKTHEMSLHNAQYIISHDWWAAYLKYVGD